MAVERKICVVTGSRAEYGLLYWVMHNIRDANDLTLQLVVTGMHLSSEFGLTYQQIEKDGFLISRKAEILVSSDTPAGIAKSMGLGMIEFGTIFESLQPNIILMLGDRFELLAAASAALVGAMPIAHIHGGETTEGAFDEAIRHSISKMSHLHFTAAEVYRRRVIQLGEHPDTVFNVGAPGLENIKKLELLDRSTLEEAIRLELGERSVLVTWHPVTLEPGRSRRDFQTLLNTLDEVKNLKLIFTKPNADTEGRVIGHMIDDYVSSHPDKAVAHTSLGQLLYLSAVKHVDGVVGNSSSGIIEAPSLKTGTINIGDRQRGRVRATSVIDCKPDENSIKCGLKKLFSDQFRERLTDIENPYGSGDVSTKIVEKLRTYPLNNILKKTFFDLSNIKSI